jgi:Protein  of unknown function (DUF3018)
MNVHTPKPNKYKAYRERKKAAGLKQVRIWALDPDVPGFREAMNAAFEREKALSDTQEAKDLQAFLDASADETWPPYE